MGEHDKLLGKLEEFVDSHKELHKTLESKLDDLTQFKTKVLSLSFFISVLVGLVSKFI